MDPQLKLQDQALEAYVFILTEMGVISALESKSWDPLFEKSIQRHSELQMLFLELNAQPENKLLVLESIDGELLELFGVHLAKQLLSRESTARRLH